MTVAIDPWELTVTMFGYAALFCERVHRYKDIPMSFHAQPEFYPVCPCGANQIGFTYHYGGALGDPNEFRHPKLQLEHLGHDTLVRHRTVRIGRLKVQVPVFHTFQVWDVSSFTAYKRVKMEPLLAAS